MDGQRQIQELNALLLKQKKKINSDNNGLKDSVKERESEIDVLKEMIRGIKLQVKSKDTDIQRLTIKIKRLEKTNEIRESMINSIAVNVKKGKQIDPDMLQSHAGAMFKPESHHGSGKKGDRYARDKEMAETQ